MEEHRAAVGIERRRNAEPLDVLTGGGKHFLHVFRCDEAHEDRARFIVDEHQKGAAGATAFEPVMITATELDHRSDMRLPWAFLPVLGPLARNGHLSGGMQPTAECLVIDDVSLVDFFGEFLQSTARAL